MPNIISAKADTSELYRRLEACHDAEHVVLTYNLLTTLPILSELLRILPLTNEPDKVLQPENELLLEDARPESSECRWFKVTFGTLHLCEQNSRKTGT